MRLLKHVVLCGLIAVPSLGYSLSVADIKKKVYEWRWPIATAAALCIGARLGSLAERSFGAPDWSRFTLSVDPTVTTEASGRKIHGDIHIYKGCLQQPGHFEFLHYDQDTTALGKCTQTGHLNFEWAKPRVN